MPDTHTRLSQTGTVLQGMACMWSARIGTDTSLWRIVYMLYFLLCWNMIPVRMSDKLTAQSVFDNALVNKDHTFLDPVVIDSNQIGILNTVTVRLMAVFVLQHMLCRRFDLGILGNDLYHRVNSRWSSLVAVQNRPDIANIMFAQDGADIAPQGSLYSCYGPLRLGIARAGNLRRYCLFCIDQQDKLK